MSTIKLDNKFDLLRGGKNEMGFLQNICKTCGWEGNKHYAYNDYQHSNCREERDRHRKKNCG